MDVQPLSELANENREDGIGQQRDERQTGINPQHEQQCKPEKHRRIGGIHHGTAEHHADGVQIAGGTRHQITRANVIVISGGEFLQVDKEIRTEVIFHLPRDALNRAPLQEPQDASKQRDTENEQREKDEPSRRYRPLCIIHHLVQFIKNHLEDFRADEHQRVRQQHQNKTG